MSTPKRRFNLLSLTFIVLCFKKSLLIRISSIFVILRGNVACVLLTWFRWFAMAVNSIVEAEFKGMSFSTLINPFRPGNSFTPESDSSLDR